MQGRLLRQKLRNGERVYGTHITAFGQYSMDLTSGLEVDFAFVCTEHVPMDRSEVGMMCAFYAAKGISPIVRIAYPSAGLACMYLDAGAEGIVAPYVETVEEVEALIGAVRYRPLKGKFLRDLLAGTRVPEEKTVQFLDIYNGSNYLIIGIESVEGINNLERLISYDGVDGVFLGPHDITCSMEIPEEYDNPTFIETVLDVIQRCRKLGKGVGLHYDSASELARNCIDAGMNLLLQEPEISQVYTKLNHDFRALRARYGDVYESTSFQGRILPR